MTGARASDRAKGRGARPFWLLVHRYGGLFMALFLVVIGLTGSIIVFNPELYAWFDPPPVVARRAAPMLDADTLRERALALVPGGEITALTLSLKRDEPFTAYVTPRSEPGAGTPADTTTDILMLDPYSGAMLRRERYSDAIWPITRKNIMPLVNRLHYQLAIPGTFGSYLFGIVALLWTLDCFVGAYLTFPMRMRAGARPDRPTLELARRGWWQRWKPAWLVKWRASAYRINFDLHRAGGLWVWLMLLVLAWTGVGFNLNEQVYVPVMRAAIGMRDAYGDLPTLSTPRAEPGLSWRQAHLMGRQLMARQATRLGFQVQREGALQYIAEKGVFLYLVRSDRDLGREDAATYVLMDGTSGAFKGLSVPTGQSAGATINSWLFALHMAQVWGLPFRLFVVAMGLVIAMLSITGVYIWLKKRRAARWSRRRYAFGRLPVSRRTRVDLSP
jgi:uncharacterized iron-regulated membrane protein